jgi:ankyrin repeat protein
MANGLDINATDGDNNTALDLASKNKEIADLLRKHGAKTGENIPTNRSHPVIYYGLKIVSSNSSSRVNKETIENRSNAANHHIKYVTTLKELK